MHGGAEAFDRQEPGDEVEHQYDALHACKGGLRAGRRQPVQHGDLQERLPAHPQRGREAVDGKKKPVTLVVSVVARKSAMCGRAQIKVLQYANLTYLTRAASFCSQGFLMPRGNAFMDECVASRR